MTSRTSGSRPFRAIIVGGGVSGLTASHVFEAAGIDHVVCERGAEVAPPWGASIAIYPSGARLLKQLGLLKAVEDASGPLSGGLTCRWPDGTTQFQCRLFDFVNEDFGHDFMLLERRAFLRVLYDNLPRKDRVLTGKKLKNIVETPDQIEAFFEDGTSEVGDIVVGCDGVHSAVRAAMWYNANEEHPGVITTDEKKAIHTEYNCLIGMGPPIPHLPNELSCTYGKDTSFLLGAQPNQTFFFAFTKVPERNLFSAPRYTDADAEAVATRVADRPVAETVLFGELWKNRTRGCLVDVEQGVLDHWHFGRIVLVGDAVAKITPNQALGGNSGMESAAVLGNVLQPLLKSGIKPSRAQISEAFHRYESLRKPRMQKIMNYSRFHTRVQAWRFLPLKLFALYILPLLPQRFPANDIGDMLRGAARIDFLPCDWPKTRVGFDDEKVTTQPKTQAKAPAIGIVVVFSSLMWALGYLSWGNKLMVQALTAPAGS